MTNYYAIIVAGGNGTRMQQSIPKQFIPLNGLPILMHTINLFASITTLSPKIILVLPQHHLTTWNKLCQQYHFTTLHQLCTGGQTRFHSVSNGLNMIYESGLVAIHDGVRPLVSKQVIINSYATAQTHDSAIPCIPLNDSIRKIENNQTTAKQRSNYLLVQTPQTFNITTLKEAYNQPFSKQFTDDASVWEAAGHTVTIIEGNHENIKITRPLDLTLAGILLPT